MYTAPHSTEAEKIATSRLRYGLPAHAFQRGWLENVLVYFDAGMGKIRSGDLIIDGAGNLYGATMGGGQGDNRNGVVFELAPSGGEFTYSMLYTFHTSCAQYGGVAMNAAGDFLECAIMAAPITTVGYSS